VDHFKSTSRDIRRLRDQVLQGGRRLSTSRMLRSWPMDVGAFVTRLSTENSPSRVEEASLTKARNSRITESNKGEESGILLVNSSDLLEKGLLERRPAGGFEEGGCRDPLYLKTGL